MTGSWVCIMGVPASLADQERWRSKAVARWGARGFTERDEAYISSLKRQLSSLDQGVSAARLELLRRVCATCFVELKPAVISSHRPVIGKFIVAGKKLLYRILTPLLEQYVREDREFKIAVVSLLAELTAQERKE